MAETGALLSTLVALLALALLIGLVAFWAVRWQRLRDRGEAPAPIEGQSDRTQIEGFAVDDATIVGERPSPARAAASAIAKVRYSATGGERAIVLEQGETIIGRGDANQVVVDDSLASRKHARIYLEGGEYWVEDCGSRNHTYVNGLLTAAPKRLRSGDRIRVGDTVLTFLLEPVLASPTGGKAGDLKAGGK